MSLGRVGGCVGFRGLVRSGANPRGYNLSQMTRQATQAESYDR